MLVYAADTLSPQHQESLRAVQAVLDGEIDGVVVPQVLLEFYATVTGPRVRHPLEPEQAWQLVEALKSGLSVLPVAPESIDRLGELVHTRPLRGQRVFDLFMAAAMKANRVERICTYDTRGFAHLGLKVVSPEELAATLEPEPSI